MFVKVCGLLNESDIEAAAAMGYSAIGIVMHKPSPRYACIDTAKRLADFARGKILSVGVTVSIEELCGMENEFDFIQLYEPYWSENFIYAGTNPPAEGNQHKYFLYDTSRGSGKREDLPLFLKGLSDRLIISGGLNHEIIGGIIKKFSPAGVDVSSGVESSRGVKDAGLMEKFIREVNDAAR